MPLKYLVYLVLHRIGNIEHFHTLTIRTVYFKVYFDPGSETVVCLLVRRLNALQLTYFYFVRQNPSKNKCSKIWWRVSALCNAIKDHIDFDIMADTSRPQHTINNRMEGHSSIRSTVRRSATVTLKNFVKCFSLVSSTTTRMMRLNNKPSQRTAEHTGEHEYKHGDGWNGDNCSLPLFSGRFGCLSSFVMQTCTLQGFINIILTIYI